MTTPVYTTTKKVAEFTNAYTAIPLINSGTPEEVGEGDNAETIFYLENRNVIAGTYTLYYAATWANSAPELTETTDYTLDKDEGKITLTSAGVTKVATTKIWSRYWKTEVSDSVIEDYINQAEDTIDNDTGHSWRETTVTEEIHNITAPYVTWQGIRVDMTHRKIKTLDENEGDKIEIWNGSEWDDYVADKTEDRNSDFWMDYKQGIVFLITTTTSKPRSARFTYRFGSSLDGEIAKAALLLSSWMLLHGDDRSVLLPEGTSNIPLPNKAEKWRVNAEKIIRDHTEFIVPYT